MSESDEERQLREVKAALDKLPPEVVQEAIRRRGGVDKALDGLRDLALHSEDEEVRADARKTLEERGLSLVLWASEDEAHPDESNGAGT